MEHSEESKKVAGWAFVAGWVLLGVALGFGIAIYIGWRESQKYFDLGNREN